jgi:hypothetical protein
LIRLNLKLKKIENPKEGIKEKKNIPNKNEEAYNYWTLIACLLLSQNFVTIKMKKIGIIVDDSSETRAKVILYSGLEDQSRLLTFAREDIKYIPNIQNNQRIRGE